MLLAAVGNGLGAKKKTAYLMKGKFHAGTNVHVLKIDKSVNSTYLKFFLDWKDLTPFARGVAMLSLPTSVLNEIPIMIPSLEEQKEIVKRLKAASDTEKEPLMDRIWGK